MLINWVSLESPRSNVVESCNRQRQSHKPAITRRKAVALNCKRKLSLRLMAVSFWMILFPPQPAPDPRIPTMRDLEGRVRGGGGRSSLGKMGTELTLMTFIKECAMVLTNIAVIKQNMPKKISCMFFSLSLFTYSHTHGPQKHL